MRTPTLSEETLQVPLSGERLITAVRTPAEGSPSGWHFIYAPGAGSSIHDPFGVYLCRQLAGRGIGAVRFQFPYQEAGKRRLDSPKVLEETWRNVIDAVRQDGLRLAVGGRSMGGRIASQVVAKGAAVDALALFAYPLRPPWRPEQQRVEHLPDIAAKTLFCSGTRDTFGTSEELTDAASLVPESTVRFLDGADHGFATLKSSDRTKEDVWEEATTALLEWLG